MPYEFFDRSPWFTNIYRKDFKPDGIHVYLAFCINPRKKFNVKEK